MVSHGFEQMTGGSLDMFRPEKILETGEELQLLPSDLNQRPMFRAAPWSSNIGSSPCSKTAG